VQNLPSPRKFQAPGCLENNKRGWQWHPSYARRSLRTEFFFGEDRNRSWCKQLGLWLTATTTFAIYVQLKERCFCVTRPLQTKFGVLKFICRDPDISPVHIPLRTIRLLHGVGHSPFHHYHPPIYNVMRSTVNLYKTERGRSVRVTQEYTSFQIFALTARRREMS